MIGTLTPAAPLHVHTRLIGIREHAEYMWRITKDENQHTLVTQEEIMS